MVLLTAFLALATTAADTTLQLHSRVFDNERRVRISYPDGYNDPGNTERTYPVLYFLEGAAAFDPPGWNARATTDSLLDAGAIEPVVLVAVDNGGSATGVGSPVKRRASEFLPWPDPTWTDDPPEPRGHGYPAFLFDEVVPLVERHVRTTGQRDDVWLAGASYSALAALYAAATRPDRVGRVLLESLAVQVGDGALLDLVATAERLPSRVYLGVGTAEGEDPVTRRAMVDGHRALADTLEDRGVDVQLVVEQGGTHWYDAWRRRLPGGLTFVATAPAPATDAANPDDGRDALQVAFQAKDADALVEVFARDGVMHQGLQTLAGRDEIRSAMADIFAGIDGPNPMVFTSDGVTELPGMAMDAGGFGPAGRGPVGRYVILTRPVDGEWRIAYMRWYRP